MVDTKIPTVLRIQAIIRRKKKFLDCSQVEMLLVAIKNKCETHFLGFKIGELYYDLVEFMIRNGLGISEVGALTVDKIDFQNRILMIDEGIVSAGRSVKEYALNPKKNCLDKSPSFR